MIIENKKIHDYLLQKEDLMREAVKVLKNLEEVEKKIAGFEVKERAITEKVDVKELKDRGDALNDEAQKKFEELNKVIKEIEDIKLAHIPKDIRDAHYALMKEREQLERERNKIFLKVQKVKDRVVPLIQKEVKPLLEEYDDIETARTKDGKVLINTFNHLVEFKRKFKR